MKVGRTNEGQRSSQSDTAAVTFIIPSSQSAAPPKGPIWLLEVERRAQILRWDGTRWSGLSWDLRMKSRGLLGEGPPVHL